MINLSYCVYLLVMVRLEKKRAAGKKTAKIWRAKNLELARARCRGSAAKWKKEHPERYKEACRKWQKDNPEKVKIRNKRWRKKPGAAQFNNKLTDSLRRRINKVLKGAPKSARTLALIGCSVSELRQHLEKQFQPGMSWETRGGKVGWQIDHVRPCASFNLMDPAQQRDCFHYSNLQPLWAVDNNKKGDAWPTD